MIIAVIISVVILLNNDFNEILPILFATGVLFITCFFGILSGYKKIKNPDKYVVTSSSLNKNCVDTAIYQNKGYTYDIACELYCEKTGKIKIKLNEDDERIIWSCSYDDFAYLLIG